MADTIVLIHGMFRNAKSWDKWVSFFGGRGYECVAESWPLHEGEPAALRASPPGWVTRGCSRSSTDTPT